MRSYIDLPSRVDMSHARSAFGASRMAKAVMAVPMPRPRSSGTVATPHALVAPFTVWVYACATGRAVEERGIEPNGGQLELPGTEHALRHAWFAFERTDLDIDEPAEELSVGHSNDLHPRRHLSR